MKQSILASIILLAYPVLGDLALAKKVILTLPGQTLSLESVVARAISSSDSYRGMISARETENVPLLAVNAALDPRITFNYHRLRNNSEASNAFSPNRTEVDYSQLQISKYFTTGTSLSADVSQSNNAIGFPPASGINVAPYYESKLGFTLSQNIWQDFFGAGTRSLVEAGELTAQANKLQINEAREQWFLNFVDIYYNAWLAQARAKAAETNVQRRDKLVSITRLKLRRGTSEAPDLFQVDSARLQSINNKERADQELGDIWRSLVLTLKMPAAFLEIDPSLIPLKLDDTNETAFKICGPENNLNSPPTESFAIKRNSLLAEASRLSLDKADWTAKPDVELRFNYNPNGINPDMAGSWEEVQQSRNPNWSVGIVATMPLWFSGERAELQKARADAIVKDVNLLTARDSMIADWVNTCRSLYRIDRALKNDRETLSLQTKRANLEEERFKIGRSTTLATVQAGDDLVAAELTLKSTEIQRRRVAWRVLQLTDKLGSRIDEIAKQDLLPRNFNL